MCILFKATSNYLLFVSALLCGFCSAAGSCLPLLFIGLRTNEPQEAAKLSGMSQSIGYALAAGGPLLMGRLSDMTGSWSVPIICLIATTIILVPIGYTAGADRKVFSDS